MLITLRPDASTVPCTDGLKRIEEHVALGQWQRSSVIFVIQEERFDEVVLVADEVSDVIGTPDTKVRCMYTLNVFSPGDWLLRSSSQLRRAALECAADSCLPSPRRVRATAPRQSALLCPSAPSRPSDCMQPARRSKSANQAGKYHAL